MPLATGWLFWSSHLIEIHCVPVPDTVDAVAVVVVVDSFAVCAIDGASVALMEVGVTLSAAAAVVVLVLDPGGQGQVQSAAIRLCRCAWNASKGDEAFRSWYQSGCRTTPNFIAHLTAS
mmetsp:Transcript_87713/g.248499  ORF Transcript_87713/g.248499 Transcript_87713/m.248499 type:complete len:119 (+) Transcript_87713:265-621(+)